LILICLVHISNATNFIWPDRYTARVHFDVADVATNFQPIFGVGWFFADYIVGGQRGDELWNLQSILNTQFYQLIDGTSDYHLNLPTTSYYIWGDYKTGLNCAQVPSGYFAQDMYASPSTFIGNGTFEGVYISVFNTTFTVGPYIIPLALFVSIETWTPVYWHMYPSYDGFVGESHLWYDTFEVVTDPFPEVLFAVPKMCPNSTIIY